MHVRTRCGISLCVASLFLFCLLAMPAGAQFAPFVSYPSGPVGNNPFNVAVGDFNHDGTPDVALADSDEGNINVGGVTLLLGNPDGTFQPAVRYSLGANQHAVGIVAADFNNDANLDLVAITGAFSGGNNSVQVLMGNGDGSFQAAVAIAPTCTTGCPTNAYIFPRAIAAGDFDGDGIVDIAVAELTQGKVAFGK